MRGGLALGGNFSLLLYSSLAPKFQDRFVCPGGGAGSPDDHDSETVQLTSPPIPGAIRAPRRGTDSPDELDSERDCENVSDDRNAASAPDCPECLTGDAAPKCLKGDSGTFCFKDKQVDAVPSGPEWAENLVYVTTGSTCVAYLT